MDFPNQHRYIINSKTITILPDYKYQNIKSQIIELDKIIFVDEAPINIIKHSLLYYGTNLKGARESAVYHLGSVNRPPIMLNREKNIYFYTTTTMVNSTNIWLSVAHTKRIYKCDKYVSEVTLANDIKIILDISFKILNNNYLRGIQLKKNNDDTIKEIHYPALYSIPLPKNEHNLIVKEKDSIGYTFLSSDDTIHN